MDCYFHAKKYIMECVFIPTEENEAFSYSPGHVWFIWHQTICCELYIRVKICFENYNVECIKIFTHLQADIGLPMSELHPIWKSHFFIFPLLPTHSKLHQSPLIWCINDSSMWIQTRRRSVIFLKVWKLTTIMAMWSFWWVYNRTLTIYKVLVVC